ncbi:MAG: hypothetical protein KBT66_09310, partial [Amphritea sp.]|nr:hypothetical protein [Amphritea sp.]
VKGDEIDNKPYIDDLCDKYLSTIMEIANDLGIHLSKICIKGINLSVLTKSRNKAITYTTRIITENIKEPTEVARYKDILNKVYPSNLERYSNHIYFNSVVKKLAEGKFSYFDINDLLEDPSVKGEVNPMYIPAKSDHHILDSLFLRKVHLDRILYQLLGL